MLSYKECNQSDFGIDYLVMSMCRVISCVVGRGWFQWPLCSLGKALLAFSLLHLILQDQICLLFQVSFDFLLLHFIPIWWKEQFVCVCVCVFIELFYFSFFSLSGWGIDLDLSNVEWFALETNWDLSVTFEIAPKYWITDFFVRW